MEILYRARNDVYAFGYNSIESEPIWIKSGARWAEYIVGGWTSQILGAIRAVETVWEAGEFI